MSCEHCRGYSVTHCPVCGEGETEVIECPKCGGDGIDHHYAYDMRTHEFVEVTEIAFLILPDDVEEAECRGEHYCKGDIPCPYCRGYGEVRVDDRGYLI